MMSFRQLLQCLASFFLLRATALATVSLSGIVEMDLIFPKNDTTYEPTDMMPLIWAIQNANLAATLSTVLSVDIFNSDRMRGDTKTLSLNATNLTGKDIYYVYLYTHKLNVEDSFFINWSPFSKNCSTDIYYDNNDTAFAGQIISFFSMAKGGQKPDFAAAQNANCSNTRSARFNITGTQKRHEGDGPANQCAMLSQETPFPVSGNPCAVKMDSAVAASITASLKAEYISLKCLSPHPTISCPAESAARRLDGQFPSKAATLHVAILGWVVYVLV